MGVVTPDPAPDLRVGNALTARRRELQMSQRTLAERAEMSEAQVQNIERGRTQPRSVLPRTRRALERGLRLAPHAIDHLIDDGRELIPAPATLADIDPVQLLDLVDEHRADEVPADVKRAALRVLGRLRRALTDAEFDAWVHGVQSSRDHAEGGSG